MKSIRTSVSLPSKQHQLLQELAESSNLSLSWVIRQAVTEFLKQHSDKDFEPLVRTKSNSNDLVSGEPNDE
jgi:Arc/MetJ-type ribon-helix-helix transcriptional regulator